MDESIYLEFRDYQPTLTPMGGKLTRVVHIYARRSGEYLGSIRWYGAWRRYCFFPVEKTAWSAGCMKAVEDYIGRMMEDRRAPAKGQRGEKEKE